MRDLAQGWFVAGFDGPCEWGDWVMPGDTVRVEKVDGSDLMEHKECREAERAVFVRPDR